MLHEVADVAQRDVRVVVHEEAQARRVPESQAETDDGQCARGPRVFAHGPQAFEQWAEGYERAACLRLSAQ